MLYLIKFRRTDGVMDMLREATSDAPIATDNLWTAYETAWRLEREAALLGSDFRVCRLVRVRQVTGADGEVLNAYDTADVPEVLH